MPTLEEAKMEEFKAGLKEVRKEREAEWEAVKKKFPINPNDSQEQQQAMWVKQQAAMLDP